MDVGNNKELDWKSKELEMLLEGGVVGAEGNHIKEVAADQTLLRWDPSISNKEKDLYHIDFV